MSKKGLYLAVLMVSGLLFAGGCGGGDDDGTVTVETGSLSKQEFIKRASAICVATRAKFAQEYGAFAKATLRQGQRDQAKALLKSLVELILVPNFEKNIEQISALGAPSGDEEEVSSFLTALQQELDEVAERPAILSETVTPFDQAEKLAKKYGLTECAESFS